MCQRPAGVCCECPKWKAAESGRGRVPARRFVRSPLPPPSSLYIRSLIPFVSLSFYLMSGMDSPTPARTPSPSDLFPSSVPPSRARSHSQRPLPSQPSSQSHSQYSTPNTSQFPLYDSQHYFNTPYESYPGKENHFPLPMNQINTSRPFLPQDAFQPHHPGPGHGAHLMVRARLLCPR